MSNPLFSCAGSAAKGWRFRADSAWKTSVCVSWVAIKWQWWVLAKAGCCHSLLTSQKWSWTSSKPQGRHISQKKESTIETFDFVSSFSCLPVEARENQDPRSILIMETHLDISNSFVRFHLEISGSDTENQYQFDIVQNFRVEHLNKDYTTITCPIPEPKCSVLPSTPRSIVIPLC